MEQGTAVADVDVPPEPFLPRKVWMVAGAVFLLHTVLVCLYVYPSYALRDSPMFIMVAASGGITHAPGSPTWAMLATIATRLIPVGDWALRTNLFCGLLGAFTLAGLYINGWLLLRTMMPTMANRRMLVVPLVGPLILNCSAGWWVQNVTAEQYSMMTAFLVLIMGLAWRLQRPGSTPSRWKLFLLLGFLAGLATGNHLSQVALGAFLFLLAFVGWQRGGVRSLLTRWVATGVGGVMGLCIYVWPLLRAPANPLVDHGNVKSFERLMWLIRREQFGSRPADEAPYGFAWEWIRSYRLIHELTLPGIALACIGLVLMGRRCWPLLVLWGSLFLPYAYGMLHAHLSQAGMFIDYITIYGVFDWHVALYLWLALAAVPALATGWEILARRRAALAQLLGGFVLATFAISGVVAGYTSSRHNSADPRLHTRAMLAPLPAGSVVMFSSDNVGFTGGYEIALEGSWPELTPMWGAPALPVYITQRIDDLTTGTLSTFTLPDSILENFIRDRCLDPNNSPLRYPYPPMEELLKLTPICDFTTTGARAHHWIAPRGFLYQYRPQPWSDEEVLAMFAEWNEQHAPALPEPNSSANQQDRRGWAELYERRGLYFFARGMFELSVADLRMAIRWLPERPRTYTTLGLAYDRLGEIEMAQAAYRQAMALQPLEPGPRLHVAVFEANQGNLRLALRLLNEELKRSPRDQRTRDLRDRIAADLEAAGI